MCLRLRTYMTNHRSRKPRRSGPVLRHHLEDEFDRVLDRLHGAGRSRRRDIERRNQQLRHRALQLFEQVLQLELEEEAFLGAKLEDVEVHPGATLLTVFVAVPDVDVVSPLAAGLEARFRAEMALHLPRKRTPRVQVRFLPQPEAGAGGGAA